MLKIPLDKCEFTLWQATVTVLIIPFMVRTLTIPFSLSFSCTYTLAICRVATCQGNVREKQIFLQVREKSGNFEKMSGNFGHLTHVRELSGNFVVTFFFKLSKLPSYKMDLPVLCLCKCLLGKYNLRCTNYCC